MNKETAKKVLLVGSGGREQATISAFLKSPTVAELYVAPGNDGMFFGQPEIDPRLHRVDLRIETEADIWRLVKAVVEKGVDLVFVGPEMPLSLGIVDIFEKEGLAIVGPTKLASRLEGSKAEAKDIMASLGIPVPEYAHFDDPQRACDYIRSLSYPVVVKADGLAAGKGSMVTASQQEALLAVEEILVKKKFGSAGDRVVIERWLDGEEFSFFAFTDGETVLPMAWARDYKAVFDGGQGANTGGMGTYSPYRKDEQALTKKVMDKIAGPLIAGCRERYGFTYKGILYIGGTFLREGDQINPYVFEINVRMGDPEAQVIYPRLKTDLTEISMGIVENCLGRIGNLDWDQNYYVCICATSGRTRGKKGWYNGYPGRYAINKPISGLEQVGDETLVFHSGTKWDPQRSQFVTAGGRVVSVVARAPELEQAREKAYREISKIQFEGMHYRKDIADWHAPPD